MTSVPGTRGVGAAGDAVDDAASRREGDDGASVGLRFLRKSLYWASFFDEMCPT
jgi:hypothetical protein